MTVYVIYSIREYGDGRKFVYKDDEIYLSLEEAKAKVDESWDFIFLTKKVKKWWLRKN